MSPASGTYEVGPKDASLRVRTTKAGMGAKLAHDLTLEAKAWSASVTFDAADPTGSSVNLTLDPTSLEVIEFSGGIKPLSDGDRKEIAKNINDKALQTKKYPEIVFRSTSISGQGSSFHVIGDLTIIGTTRPTTLQANVADGGQVTITGTVVQTEFGVKPYSAMLGTLKINDAVELEAIFTLPG